MNPHSKIGALSSRRRALKVASRLGYLGALQVRQLDPWGRRLMLAPEFWADGLRAFGAPSRWIPIMARKAARAALLVLVPLYPLEYLALTDAQRRAVGALRLDAVRDKS